MFEDNITLYCVKGRERRGNCRNRGYLNEVAACLLHLHDCARCSHAQDSGKDKVSVSEEGGVIMMSIAI